MQLGAYGAILHAWICNREKYYSGAEAEGHHDAQWDQSPPDETNIKSINNFNMQDIVRGLTLTLRQKFSMFHEKQLDPHDLGKSTNAVILSTLNFPACIKGAACKLIKFKLG